MIHKPCGPVGFGIRIRIEIGFFIYCFSIAMRIPLLIRIPKGLGAG
jgi:hypothetical protein